MDAYIYIYICIYTCVHVNTYVHAKDPHPGNIMVAGDVIVRIDSHIYTYTHVNTNIHVHDYTFARVRSSSTTLSGNITVAGDVLALIDLQTYTYSHIYTYKHIHIHIYMHRCIFMITHVHTPDPHPGNIMVAGDVIALIDFGQVKRLSTPQRLQL